MSRIEDIFDLVLRGKGKDLPDKIKEAVDAGEDPKDILIKGMIAAMDEIGARFTRGEIFVPEMMVSANAMKKGVASLKPFMAEGDSAGIGTVITATVAGDLHDIGKNLVAMMLESAGFEVIDLGCDVPTEAYIKAIQENPSTKIICCSALLTTTMPAMPELIKALEDAGMRDQVKILIGGAPVTQKFCEEIGADGYGDDATAAVKLAKEAIAV